MLSRQASAFPLEKWRCTWPAAASTLPSDTLHICLFVALILSAGIGISIGKVALYVAGGGFHPEHSLPVVLDVGCNRPELVEDKFYLVSDRKPCL